MDAFEKFLRQYFISPMFHNHWVDSNQSNSDIDNQINNIEMEVATTKKALDGLLSITENLANPQVLDKIQELTVSITERSDAIQELEESKGTGNKKQSLEETLSLLDLAFNTDDTTESIKTRVKLKQLLNATFDYFEMTRVDSSNGKVLHYLIDLGFKGKSWKYQSIDAPTAYPPHEPTGRLVSV
ncbi:hypothetical protein AB6D11_25690 [Vibrio splendidus]